jgi:vancomycin permeability regulator SanA
LSAAALAGVVASELAHFLAARSWPPELVGGPSTALIVLGCPAMQRWRVDIAVRSLARVPHSQVVFTGAAWKRGRQEAVAMAAYARRCGVAEDAVLVEATSTSTWENIERALGLVGDVEQLAVVSDPLHAARGRRYVVAQRPELTARLVRADDFRFFEHPWLKVASVAYELPRIAWNRRRLLTRHAS